MFVAVVTKLQARCPLKYSFLRAYMAFNSSLMVEHPAASSTALQTNLVAAKQRTPDDCDAAELQ